MRDRESLIDEAVAADVSGWGFDWLDGRAVEERPPWGFARLLADRVAEVESLLDLDTGGGEVLAGCPVLPRRTVATEAWPPNVERARDRLGPRGVEVVEVAEVTSDAPLPFPSESFELVTARHPVSPPWAEIHRVLVPGGHYLAQHVGPASAFELIEAFLGPLTEERQSRDPVREVAAAEAAGLVLTDLRTARCRMELYDIGAVVWILRKCVWWVPDFTVERYRDTLVALDDQMRDGHPVVAHSTRHLIDMQRPVEAGGLSTG